MENVFLFTGDNIYALEQEARRWKDSFTGKHGEENYMRLDAKGLQKRDLIDIIATAPFIAEKRLVRVDGLPSFDKVDGEAVFQSVHPATILLFVAPELDKRLAFSKLVLQSATTKEFSQLTPADIRQWLQRELESAGITEIKSTVDFLLQSVGTDQSQLQQELAKLTLYNTVEPLTMTVLQDLVIPSSKQQIWGLMDALGSSTPKAALQYVQKLSQQGESAFGTWAIFMWICTQLSLVHAGLSAGISSPPALVKQAGVSFGAAKSLLPVARRLSPAGIAAVMQLAAETDVALKTGALRATQDSEIEVQASLDGVILATFA